MQGRLSYTKRDNSYKLYPFAENTNKKKINIQTCYKNYHIWRKCNMALFYFIFDKMLN